MTVNQSGESMVKEEMRVLDSKNVQQTRDLNFFIERVLPLGEKSRRERVEDINFLSDASMQGTQVTQEETLVENKVAAVVNQVEDINFLAGASMQGTQVAQEETLVENKVAAVVNQVEDVDFLAGASMQGTQATQGEALVENIDFVSDAVDSLKKDDMALEAEEIRKKVVDFYAQEDTDTPLIKKKRGYHSSRAKSPLPSYEKTKQDMDEKRYAGFWVRGFAFLIDFFIVLGSVEIVSYLTKLDAFFTGEALSGPWKFILTKNALFLFVFVLYYFIANILSKGQSIGKILLGIRVVSDTKDELAVSDILVREVAGKYVLFKLPIIFLFLVFSHKKHSLFDYLTDTSVVKEKYL